MKRLPARRAVVVLALAAGLLAGCSADGGDPGWRFDLVSALVGSLLTWAVVGLLYRNRAVVADQRARAGLRFRQLRDDLTSGADRRYRRELARTASQLRVGSWAVPLETVYLPPFLQLPVPEPNPFSPPDANVDWVAWAWPEVRRILPGPPGRRLRPAQVFANNWRVLLTGEPGTGKSTLLAYLALVASGGATHADFNLEGSPLPLWAHCADLLDELQRRGDDPAQALIDAALQRLGAITGQRLPNLARRRLREGRCLILLDGLDELLPAERPAALEWIERLVKRYPDNRLVVAAPPGGVQPLRPLGFVDLTFAPWTTHTLQRIRERWSAATPREAPEPGEEPPPPPRVPSWMETPLDVVLAEFIEHMRAHTPGSRFELYGTVTSAALWTPENLPLPAKKSGSSLTGLPYPPANVAEALLAGTAFDMLSSGRSAVPWQEVEMRLGDVFVQQNVGGYQDLELLVERLARYSGLLEPRSHRRLGMPHPTIRSYLVARQLATLGDAGLVRQLYTDPTFTEAIAFYSGLADATLGPLVGDLLSTTGDVLRTPVFTAASWAGMAPANAAWRGPVMAAAARLMLQPNELPTLRERATAALVASHDPGVGLLLKRALSVAEERLRVLATLGLGALRELTPPDAVALLNARLSDDSSAVRVAAARALGAIGGEAALDGLVSALLEGDDALRRAAAEGLGRNPGEGQRVLQEGIADRDYLVRRAAAYGLFSPAAAGHEWATRLLQNAEREDTEWFVRSAATESLQRLAELYTPHQFVMPRAENLAWLIQWAAQKGQGVGTGAAALKALGAALIDDEPRVRGAAALTLAEIGEASAEEPLRRMAAGDPDPDAREAGLIALAVLTRLLGRSLLPEPPPAATLIAAIAAATAPAAAEPAAAEPAPALTATAAPPAPAPGTPAPEATAPAAGEPAAAELAAAEPAAAEPAAAEPAAAEPAAAEPAAAEPAIGELVASEAAEAEPVQAEPAQAEPPPDEPAPGDPAAVAATSAASAPPAPNDPRGEA
jgi:HEAT repeat protein